MKNAKSWRKAAWLGAAFCALLLATGCQTNPAAPGTGGNMLGSLSSALSGNGSNTGKGNGLTDGIRDVFEGTAAVFKDYSAADQQALGAGFSSVLLGARPLLRNDAVQRYVNQVGRWVAMQAERPLDKDGKEINFSWRFGVIDSDAVNAYATPGGFVFVTVGLMRQLNSEAELAGVLAHEIAHVMRGHYLVAIKKGGLTQMAGGIVRAKADNAEVSSAVVNAVRNIYAKGLDQSDEFDADRQALLYAARAGYAPAGLPTVLKMYAAKGSKSDANYQLLLGTHPAPADRAARLDSLLTGKFATAAGVTNEVRYAAIKRQLR
jgi:predicted Zn-dependent protease